MQIEVLVESNQVEEWRKYKEQEAQLMLTNPRDVFRGQSRLPNIVPFHPYIRYTVLLCKVTLSLRRGVFSDI